ncbi:probable receptor-like protein kinase At1g49730 [Impatiens glandulifera]|uniref:probable receptor-like protein kinase At1g49730 n=1 Tax=Impatiens glandulifera TaxID=253017 RepID=UPI001FB19EC3|nr:probable receptor-like protein kinase At1g49730 [Impatiens glandulifera]XP_047329728.1 probable receptor-like protein kinase At1g49730 [Impatiens glandulifera]
MTVVAGGSTFLALLIYFNMQFSEAAVAVQDCPLDISGSNFSLAATTCSNKEDRGKCCRYINAFVAVSVARYANVTGNLGVNSDMSRICLNSISKTLQIHGVTPNATIFCGFGFKIPVNYECQRRTTVTEMLQSPRFRIVKEKCTKQPLSVESNCRKCLNSGIVYLRNLIISPDNTTLTTCRDATFAALASQTDNMSVAELANCFFGVQGLFSVPPILKNSSSSMVSPPPEVTPSPIPAASPNQLSMTIPVNKKQNRSYHLTLGPAVGIAVTSVAVLIIIVLVFLIRRKKRQLHEARTITTSNTTSPTASSQIQTRRLSPAPLPLLMKIGYKETKKATNNFVTVVGQGGFGTVYKAQFEDGSTLAVKRMDKVESEEQADDDFCREIEILSRLHHRHLVALKGFCTGNQERFLMYEYMGNGSLKDHLHSPGRTPLSWRTRVQIAIDVANALEYLHFYCDPPLCHRDIKSSNILLDDSFVAKVADFGLAHVTKHDTISFEPVTTVVRGTPGYMDPEYVIMQELTDKSDVYSYGVLLLELVTARKAIQDNKNLVEWSQAFISSDSSRLIELVDSSIRESFNFYQLETIVSLVKWCTQREGRARPSIKQVLRLLYECCDPLQNGFLQAVEDNNEEEEEVKMKNNNNDKDLASSSSSSTTTTSRSTHGSRCLILDTTSSPHSPTQGIH